MPYTVRQRVLERSRVQGTSRTPRHVESDVPRRFEAVYSYRTSGRARNDRTLSEVSSAPMDLGERMLHRTKTQERLLAELLPDERKGDSQRLLTSDFGHDFAVMKHFEPSRPASYRRWTSSSLSVLDSQASGIRPRARCFPRLDGTTVFSTSMPLDPAGVFTAAGATSLHPVVGQPMSPVFLKGVGAQQIAEMNPVQNRASILATLLELARGDVPKVVNNLYKHVDAIAKFRKEYTSLSKFEAARKRAAELGKAAGSDYLALQFSWSPVFRDINAAISILNQVDELLFVSGDTRRQAKWDSKSWSLTNSMSLQWGPYGHNLGVAIENDPLVTSSPGSDSFGIFTHAVTTEAHLVGSMDIQTTAKYLTGLKATSAANGFFDRGMDLLGLKLDVRTIWELTPWSWLLEWFSNMGAIVSNLNNLTLSGVLLNYGYTTARLKYSVAYSAAPTSPNSSNGYREFKNPYFVEQYDAKVRLASNPFGLFVDPGTFSGFQWSILTSLGLARLR